MKLSGGMPWIDETLLCNCREKESTKAFLTMSTTTQAWFRTRQPKKLISTTKKATEEPTTLPIDATTTVDKSTTKQQHTSTNYQKTTNFRQTITTNQIDHQATSSESTTTFNDGTTTWTQIVTMPYSTRTDAPAPMTTILSESTTWTTSSPYFLPTQGATTMFSRTKKDIEWYKKHSKWRHFLN